ncbi:MAG: RnfABCDGE type electron transport complex subunit A [Oscillospiraceae bacterium]|nr:RnfABCDGE type electron transport complex subunit A [Oscillospiraceae bacterium]
MDFSSLIIIMMSAVLVNNFVLIQFLGICPFLGVSKKLDSAIGMGLAVLFVMMIASAATWPIYALLLAPNGLGYLQTIVFIVIIAALVQLVEITMKRFMPALYKNLGIFLPLMTTNCAVFAATLLNVSAQYNYAEAMTNAFGAGAGFLLAMVIFAGIREHTENADPPACIKGLPLALFSVAILAMAFMGFGGVVENLFG